ncbi:hypothetical protein J437_LFUL016372 [Ladona fulva]|uniref:G-protein coupled receptors family 1 profile domain-containing protein n=1 Tax=Ladona fulva TaxID=123851 RepID=A0A8K0NWR6_LADFU|nr:hypothetical protein J437_LFUL016372 [Ladona fulva]
MLAGPRSTGEGETGCAASGSSDGAAVRALVRATLGTAVRGGATHTRSGSNSLRGGSGSGRGIGTGCGDGAAVRRSRKQVVMMLGTVVFSFFVCLFPFRIVILMTITNEFGALGTLGPDTYYPVMYGSRLLIYLHSALDPCLYSLMSSKFRRGLGRIFCGWRRVRKLRRCYRMRVPGEAGSEMGATRNGAASSPHTGSLRTSSFSRTLRGSRGKSLKGEPPKLSTLEEGASGCEARSSEAKDAAGAPRAEPPVAKTSLLVEQVVAGGEIFL